MAEMQALTDLFFNILRKMKKEWRKELNNGISPSQYLMLKALKLVGPQKATELAEVIQMTPGAVTGASDKLVAEGYAERKGAEGDRRVVYLELTDKGKHLVEDLIEKQKKVTAKFFEGLSEEDIKHLIRIYSLISDNLEREAPLP